MVWFYCFCSGVLGYFCLVFPLEACFWRINPVFWYADFSWVVVWLRSMEPLLTPSAEGSNQRFLGCVGSGLSARVY